MATINRTSQYVGTDEYDSYLEPSDENGATLLQRAVVGDDQRAVRVIVQRRGRAALKETDKLGNTALHTACYHGKVIECSLRVENCSCFDNNERSSL